MKEPDENVVETAFQLQRSSRLNHCVGCSISRENNQGRWTASLTFQ